MDGYRAKPGSRPGAGRNATRSCRIVRRRRNPSENCAVNRAGKSDSDRGAGQYDHGSHGRRARLLLELARLTVERTEQVIARSRRVLDLPVYPYDPPRAPNENVDPVLRGRMRHVGGPRCHDPRT